MGFISNLVSATLKTAITPVAVVKNVANIIQGEEVESTKDLIESACEDLGQSLDDLSNGYF